MRHIQDISQCRVFNFPSKLVVVIYMIPSYSSGGPGLGVVVVASLFSHMPDVLSEFLGYTFFNTNTG